MFYITREEIVRYVFWIGCALSDMHNFYHLKALNEMKLLNILKME